MKTNTTVSLEPTQTPEAQTALEPTLDEFKINLRDINYGIKRNLELIEAIHKYWSIYINRKEFLSSQVLLNIDELYRKIKDKEHGIIDYTKLSEQHNLLQKSLSNIKTNFQSILASYHKYFSSIAVNSKDQQIADEQILKILKSFEVGGALHQRIESLNESEKSKFIPVAVNLIFLFSKLVCNFEAVRINKDLELNDAKQEIFSILDKIVADLSSKSLDEIQDQLVETLLKLDLENFYETSLEKQEQADPQGNQVASKIFAFLARDFTDFPTAVAHKIIFSTVASKNPQLIPQLFEALLESATEPNKREKLLKLFYSKDISSRLILNRDFDNFKSLLNFITSNTKEEEKFRLTDFLTKIYSSSVALVRFNFALEIAQQKEFDPNALTSIVHSEEGPPYELTLLNLTCLFTYANDVNYGLIEMLLEKKADVNITDSLGNTSLYAAAENGLTDIVKLLLDKNVNPVKQEHIQGAFYIACRSSKLEVVKLFLDKIDIKAKNKEGQDPLHLVFYGRIDIELIKLLLEKGANFSNRNSFGETPLDLACRYGNRDAVQLYLDKISNDAEETVDNDGTERMDIDDTKKIDTHSLIASAIAISKRNSDKGILKLLEDFSHQLSRSEERQPKSSVARSSQNASELGSGSSQTHSRARS